MQLLTLAPKPVPASSPTATLPLPSTLVTERVITDGCVAGARRVGFHGKITERIIFTAVIGEERVPPMSVVECTTYIGEQERVVTDCVVVAAISLLNRANVPTAVLSCRVVLLKSAPAPTAVFWSAVLISSVPRADTSVEAGRAVA